MAIADLLPQLLFNSVVTGSVFALATVGFSLTYSILKFPNIAQAAFITFGAYFAYSISTLWGLGFALGILTALLATGTLGAISYLVIFRPLGRRVSGFVAPTVASVGYGLALTFIIQQIWGRDLLLFSTIFEAFSLGPFRTNWLWNITIIFTLIVVVAIHYLLSRTKFGAAMRGTSSNPDLVRASGIRIDRVLILVWFLGSGLAGTSGVFLAGQNGATPALGSNMLVTVMAVAIFAGVGSFYGVIAAAYILSFAENLSIPLLLSIGQPSFYSIAVAYAVVIVTLLFFPRGISGTGPKFDSLFAKMRKVV
jgi:branched-subunit amino acid ABC-type transport system permease component